MWLPFGSVQRFLLNFAVLNLTEIIEIFRRCYLLAGRRTEATAGKESSFASPLTAELKTKRCTDSNKSKENGFLYYVIRWACALLTWTQIPSLLLQKWANILYHHREKDGVLCESTSDQWTFKLRLPRTTFKHHQLQRKDNGYCSIMTHIGEILTHTLS